MGKKFIIACESMKPEFDYCIGKMNTQPSITYLKQDFHRHPENIRDAIQKILDRGENKSSKVVLGYGLCSNGVVGIIAPEGGMIIPKVHDCIAIYLGSKEKYNELFAACPGTYYLTPGWLAAGKDPLTTMRNEYAQRVGKDNAEKAMRQELKHYKKIVVIDTGIRENIRELKNTAFENASFFGLEYSEIKGDLSLFRQAIEGPYNKENFVIVTKGEKVKQSDFLK